MRTGWVVLALAGGIGAGFVGGLLVGVASALPQEQRAAEASGVPEPLPDQAVLYEGQRMSYAEAQRKHAALKPPPGFTLDPLPNPNSWITYQGLRMTWAQAQEIAACELRLAERSEPADDSLAATQAIVEFNNRQRAKADAEALRLAVANAAAEAVREEARRQENTRVLR